MKPELTQERLKEVLNYDPETGVFAYVNSKGNRKAGDVAGIFDIGYVKICVLGKQHLAHRLAWLYVNGEWPKGFIDHIDNDRSNNRISNLREATNGENLQNITKAKSSNKSGLLGVSFHNKTGRFFSRISLNGKNKSLGYFNTPEEAHAAYMAAKRELHEFNTL